MGDVKQKRDSRSSEKETVDTPQMYKVGDIVLCEHETVKYQSKINGERIFNSKKQFLIHYVGFNERENEWVDMDHPRISKYTATEDRNPTPSAKKARESRLSNSMNHTPIPKLTISLKDGTPTGRNQKDNKSIVTHPSSSPKRSSERLAKRRMPRRFSWGNKASPSPSSYSASSPSKGGNKRMLTTPSPTRSIIKRARTSLSPSFLLNSDGKKKTVRFDDCTPSPTTPTTPNSLVLSPSTQLHHGSAPFAVVKKPEPEMEKVVKKEEEEELSQINESTFHNGKDVALFNSSFRPDSIQNTQSTTVSAYEVVDMLYVSQSHVVPPVGEKTAFPEYADHSMGNPMDDNGIPTPLPMLPYLVGGGSNREGFQKGSGTIEIPAIPKTEERQIEEKSPEYKNPIVEMNKNGDDEEAELGEVIIEEIDDENEMEEGEELKEEVMGMMDINVSDSDHNYNMLLNGKNIGDNQEDYDVNMHDSPSQISKVVNSKPEEGKELPSKESSVTENRLSSDQLNLNLKQDMKEKMKELQKKVVAMDQSVNEAKELLTQMQTIISE